MLFFRGLDNSLKVLDSLSGYQKLSASEPSDRYLIIAIQSRDVVVGVFSDLFSTNTAFSREYIEQLLLAGLLRVDLIRPFSP